MKTTNVNLELIQNDTTFELTGNIDTIKLDKIAGTIVKDILDEKSYAKDFGNIKGGFKWNRKFKVKLTIEGEMFTKGFELTLNTNEKIHKFGKLIERMVIDISTKRKEQILTVKEVLKNFEVIAN